MSKQKFQVGDYVRCKTIKVFYQHGRLVSPREFKGMRQIIGLDRLTEKILYWVHVSAFDAPYRKTKAAIPFRKYTAGYLIIAPKHVVLEQKILGLYR